MVFSVVVPLEDDAQNTVFTVSLICVCLRRRGFHILRVHPHFTVDDAAEGVHDGVVLGLVFKQR